MQSQKQTEKVISNFSLQELPETMRIIDSILKDKKAIKLSSTQKTISCQYQISQKQFNQDKMILKINVFKEDIMLEFSLNIPTQIILEIGTGKMLQIISKINTDIKTAEFNICYQQSLKTLLIKTGFNIRNFFPQNHSLIFQKLGKIFSCAEEIFMNLFSQFNLKKPKNATNKVSDIIQELQSYKKKICSQISNRTRSHTHSQTISLHHRDLTLPNIVAHQNSNKQAKKKQNNIDQHELQIKAKQISLKFKKHSPKISSVMKSNSKSIEQEKLPFIVRPIQLCKIVSSQSINSVKNGYGIIWKIHAFYKILLSVNSDVNLLLQSLQQKNLDVEQCINDLCMKKPKLGDNCKQSHNSEIEILLYLRNFQSDKIAQYFLTALPEKNFQSIYCKWYNMSFKNLIETKGNIKQKLACTKTLVEGIKFLKSINLNHRDLKPENVMIEELKNAKIIDFGSACPFYGLESNLKVSKILRSTLKYCIPYCYAIQSLKQQYTQQAFNEHQNFDIYGLGIIIQEIFEQSGVRAQLGQSFNKNISWLISKCKIANPQHRMNADQVYSYIKILWKVWMLNNPGTKKK